MRSAVIVIALVLGTAPALADPAKQPRPAKGSPDEVVCHREEVTGSLARFVKTCMTRAQWTRQSDVAQSQKQALDDRGSINSCGAASLGECK